jgi:hypothetical protein
LRASLRLLVMPVGCGVGAQRHLALLPHRCAKRNVLEAYVLGGGVHEGYVYADTFFSYSCGSYVFQPF